MTEKDHYKYGLSGDKVDVEVAERLRAKIRTLAAELAEAKALWHERSGTVRLHEIRIRALEADKADLVRVLGAADERIKALEAALKEAMEWNWLSDEDDIPNEVLKQIESALIAGVANSVPETKGESNGG
jgi:hypothetical protein